MLPPLRKPCFLLLLFVIFLAFGGMLHPAVTFKLYDAYAHQRVNIKSWPKPWKHFPFNEAFYQITSRTAEVVSATGSTLETNPSVCGKFILDHPPHKIYEPIVPCNDFEDLHVNICALQRSARNVSQEDLPRPVLGSQNVYTPAAMGCVDREARFGHYTEQSWARADLGAMQRNCVRLNRHRFKEKLPDDYSLPGKVEERVLRPVPRTAVVLRAWTGFNWTEDDVHNVRAMVAELTFSSGGEYEVFILMQVRDDFEGDPAGDLGIPASLRGLVKTWTTADCEEAYPDVGEYNVYWHTFMALQLFAQRHPNFDFFWNWEMDARSLGHYGQTLSDLSKWARVQPKDLVWTRNDRFYIPSYHGTYDQFSKAVEFAGLEDPDEAFIASERPPSPSHIDPEEADLVTLFPMFDTKNTIWPWRNHLINLTPSEIARPLRVSVVTNLRLSRPLLSAMHAQNVAGKAMPCEMVPPTVALHHGYKAVFVPHPVYHDRVWPADATQFKFNAGPGGQVGGSLDTVMNQEHYFDRVSYFWNARFGLELYRKWLGLADEGPGSAEWEAQHGRICLPPMILHPVKSSQIYTHDDT